MVPIDLQPDERTVEQKKIDKSETQSNNSSESGSSSISAVTQALDNRTPVNQFFFHLSLLLHQKLQVLTRSKKQLAIVLLTPLLTCILLQFVENQIVELDSYIKKKGFFDEAYDGMDLV